MAGRLAAAGVVLLSMSIVGGLAFAGDPAGGAHRAPICFGGAPETVVAGATGASDIAIGDGRIYWSNVNTRRVSRSALATPAIMPLDPPFGDDLLIGAVDGDEVFAVTDGDGIVAFDRRDGSFRFLLADTPTILGPLDRPLKVDARYLYFSRTGTPAQATGGDGFFRLPRDGSSRPELLGPPIPGDSPLEVAGGFVYFRARVPDGRLALVRRALTPGAPIQVVTALPEADPPPKFPAPGLLRVVDGIAYYSDQASSGSIWSVPTDGSAKPVRRLPLGEVGAVDMLIEGGCLYYATGTQIWRWALAGPGSARPALVADRRTYHDGLHGPHSRLATDGHYLYWTDTGGNRIMRAARDRRPLPLRVANSTGIGPKEVSAWRVTLGDGWGCVGSWDDVISRWQCWSAGAVGSAPTQIEAHRVPWLDGLQLQAGPDRLCAAVRGTDPPCWPWPEIARHQPRTLPEARLSQGAGSLLQVGGTFTCISYSSIWFCAGDDRFGQLANAGDLIRSVGWSGAAGLWHGCVRGGDSLSCWGRGDGGQLGFAPADSCRDGSQSVACSRSLRRVPFVLPPDSEILAGDMFTCALADRHLQCWGASRDGLFGTAAACPAGLQTRWPTLSGHVSAPGATCSSIPADVPGLPAPIQQISVGPRGACASKGDRRGYETHCAGAIATPAIGVQNIAVGPGDRASACGIAGRDVVCWGDGYSPPDNPGLPIRITYDQSPLPRTAALDTSPPGDGPWPATCGIHYGCAQAARPLTVCAPGPAAQRWTDVQPKAAALVGKKIRVRGPLVLSAFDPYVFSNMLPTGSACGKDVCCKADPVPVVIGGAYQELGLDGFQCVGDESRHCCNLAPMGQTVIAEGVLKLGYPAYYSLADVTLCTQASGP